MADDFEHGFGDLGGPGPADGERQLNLHFSHEVMAGTYANYARVRHTPYELTVTFGEVGDGADGSGLAVARVHMSPRFASELIDALDDNFSKWRYTQGVRDLPESDAHHESEDADEEVDDLPSQLAQVERGATRPALPIALEPQRLPGVYANFANVSHSDYEFTISFARLDHEVDDVAVPGVVVLRINCAPLFLRELIDLLEAAYGAWHEAVAPEDGEDG